MSPQRRLGSMPARKSQLPTNWRNMDASFAGMTSVVKRLEPRQAVATAELRSFTIAMLPDTRSEVACHANVQRSERFVRHDVNPTTLHSIVSACSAAWMPGFAGMRESIPSDHRLG